MFIENIKDSVMPSAHPRGGVPLLLSSPGNSPRWYPMRVTYGRELRVKARFDEFGIESFIPMRYEFVIINGYSRRKLVPGVSNLIFVRSTQERITSLKNTDQWLLPLRYMMSRPISEERSSRIITVPDRDMENFINACRVGENIEYLRYDPFLDRPGQRVRIIDGPFAGVEGVVKRIRKNRQVVVLLSGVLAVMLNSVPCAWLEKIQ